MLYDVKVRLVGPVPGNPVQRSERFEVVTVEADSGDGAADMAAGMHPSGYIVGVAPQGQLSRTAGADPVLEADDRPPDDEDAEPPPSNRELAEINRSVAAVAAAARKRQGRE